MENIYIWEYLGVSGSIPPNPTPKNLAVEPTLQSL